METPNRPVVLPGKVFRAWYVRKQTEVLTISPADIADEQDIMKAEDNIHFDRWAIPADYKDYQFKWEMQ